jgi:hypothetical protein
MKPDNFFRYVLDPALSFNAPLIGVPASDRATVLLMAIAGQESAWEWRRQRGGPARSYWQFERWGGVAEVMQKCTLKLQAVTQALDIQYQPDVIFEAMTWNDTLAAAMARLLLWQDAAPLPAIGAVDAAWAYYQRNWRPGAPHPKEWPQNYATALKACGVSVDQLQLSL